MTVHFTGQTDTHTNAKTNVCHSLAFTHTVYMQHLMTCRSERENGISAFMAMQCSQCDEGNEEKDLAEENKMREEWKEWWDGWKRMNRSTTFHLYNLQSMNVIQNPHTNSYFLFLFGCRLKPDLCSLLNRFSKVFTVWESDSPKPSHIDWMINSAVIVLNLRQKQHV